MPNPQARPTLPLVLRSLTFLITVFLSAFLLFQIQPLISKHILPWFGGTPAVWTTCLFLFQALLFCGYTYAHFLTKLSIRAQCLCHGALLLCASLVSIVPSETWKPEGGENPLVLIPLMLLLTVGLPYFLLSASGPLLQAWFWRTCPEQSPYPLYAVSNTGSLLALLSFPFLVEPNLSGPQQAGLWRLGFWGFALLWGLVAIFVWNSRPPTRRSADDALPAETKSQGLPVDGGWKTTLLWIGWSACGVMLFMGVTNHLTLNVASVPFLWVLPLSVYLLSFIIVFHGFRWYSRRVAFALLVIATVVLLAMLQIEISFIQGSGFHVGFLQQVAVHAIVLLMLCLVCHGELHRLRPGPGRLTNFYLCIAFGGAVGGLTVGILAPAALLLNQELHLAILACCMLYLVTSTRDPTSRLYRGGPRWRAALSVTSVVALAGLLSYQTWVLLDDALLTRRNLFGTLRLIEEGNGDPSTRALTLVDGLTLHGQQYLDQALQQRPTAYYTPQTGVGSALSLLERGAGRRVGIVGLGAGTLAAYGQPSDYFRFYEINPEVVDVATNWFTYLPQSAARWEIVLGDARLSLDREPPQRFDVLILDAFSSDSIPIHLLTVEAFEIYEQHLSPTGVIAINTSSLHLDLSPVVYQLAWSRQYHALNVVNRDDLASHTSASSWMILSRDPEFLNALVQHLEPLRGSGQVLLARRPADKYKDLRPWTDHENNLFRILR